MIENILFSLLYFTIKYCWFQQMVLIVYLGGFTKCHTKWNEIICQHGRQTLAEWHAIDTTLYVCIKLDLRYSFAKVDKVPKCMVAKAYD